MGTRRPGKGSSRSSPWKRASPVQESRCRWRMTPTVGKPRKWRKFLRMPSFFSCDARLVIKSVEVETEEHRRVIRGVRARHGNGVARLGEAQHIGRVDVIEEISHTNAQLAAALELDRGSSCSPGPSDRPVLKIAIEVAAGLAHADEPIARWPGGVNKVSHDRLRIKKGAGGSNRQPRGIGNVSG